MLVNELEVREAARRSMMASDLSYLGHLIPPFLRHAYIASCITATLTVPSSLWFSFSLSFSLSLSQGTLWHPTPLINIRPRSQEHRQVPLCSASRGDPPPQTPPLVTSTHRLSPNILWATFPQSRPVTLSINGPRCWQPTSLSPIPTCPK